MERSQKLRKQVQQQEHASITKRLELWEHRRQLRPPQSQTAQMEQELKLKDARRAEGRRHAQELLQKKALLTAERTRLKQQDAQEVLRRNHQFLVDKRNTLLERQFL